MQQAIPYRTWLPPSSSSGSATATATAVTNSGGPQPQPPDKSSDTVKIGKLVAENAVIVFGRRGCCMCHVVKSLLLGLSVNPPVVEVNEHEEAAVIDELSRIVGVDEGKGGQGLQFPAVFVGGKLFGGLERVMATHISGELVPLLKEAGALWL